MELYGLIGKTHHGFDPVLTVMGPAGARAVAAHVAPPDGVAAVTAEGRWPHYIESREGALAELIAAHGIVVLDRPAWQAKKAALGAAAGR